MPALQQAGKEHLFECPSCRGVYESFSRLDVALRRSPAISCEAALPLLSARLDREVDEAEAAIANAHLGACAGCHARLASFGALDAALRALPSGTPSARVDRAIAGLRRQPRTARIPAIAARGLVAVATAVLLVMAGLSRSLAPAGLPVTTERTEVLVAAAQQVVLNSRTNTLYVLDVKAAAVDARDASTNDLKVRIDVGGQPTALALNESANTVLVLDASQKKLTEIDATSNKVIGASTFAVSGTPTSVSVDPSSSKIVVTSSATTTTSPSLTVIDGRTKKVESVRDLSVAAEVMVFDAAGNRAALVSPTATSLLDENYKVTSTLPGGVSAAFGQGGGDRVAILSANAGASVISFGGRGAPINLNLPGTPRAITALPDGGFLVLVELGGKSRVSYVAPDGHEGANTDLAVVGGDLFYDNSTKRFSVAGKSGVASADVPTALISAVASAPAASASASASPSPSPTTSTSPAPTASPSASPSSPIEALASPSPKPLELAAVIAQNFVHLDLPAGRNPFAVSKSGERLWVLDDKNFIDTVDLGTGEMVTIMSLPRSAQISQFVAGRDRLYALDTGRGDLYVITMSTRELTTYTQPFLKPVASLAVGLDDRLWIGVSDASFLLRFDPKTKATESFDLAGAHVSKLTTDGFGSIYYADDARNAVGTLNPTTGRITEFAFPRHGVTTGLVVDRSSTLWLGTSAGEVWSVRGGTATLTVGLQRPVTMLVLDASGRAWYMAPAPAGAIGFSYATADGANAGSTVGGPAFSLAFNALGRAWLADPRGGFFVSRSQP